MDANRYSKFLSENGKMIEITEKMMIPITLVDMINELKIELERKEKRLDECEKSILRIESNSKEIQKMSDLLGEHMKSCEEMFLSNIYSDDEIVSEEEFYCEQKEDEIVQTNKNPENLIHREHNNYKNHDNHKNCKNRFIFPEEEETDFSEDDEDEEDEETQENTIKNEISQTILSPKKKKNKKNKKKVSFFEDKREFYINLLFILLSLVLTFLAYFYNKN